MISGVFWPKTVSVCALFTLATLALFSPTVNSAECRNETFLRVLERGFLTVGLKADYKPWGFRNAEGELVGMEADMAREVADAMGVALKTVEVNSSNRIQMLANGDIDLMIATMSDRADRRELVGIAQPNYYTSGTNVMTEASSGIKEWTDLQGKTVCGKQGAFYNKMVEERFGAKVTAFDANEDAKLALRNGECAAWVYDDSSIMSDLASGDWEGYEMPLRSEDSNPWGLAVPLAEKNCIFGQMMSGLQYNWLASGKLIELEKKWGIQPTEFLQNEHKRLADWLLK